MFTFSESTLEGSLFEFWIRKRDEKKSKLKQTVELLEILIVLILIIRVRGGLKALTTSKSSLFNQPSSFVVSVCFVAQNRMVNRTLLVRASREHRKREEKKKLNSRKKR